MSFLVLGIESSCDETAAAVVENGNNTLSNVVSSQVDIHKEFGGVVPELASRKHIETIIPIIKKSLKDAKINLQDIDGIAATAGPGLIGSLMVGHSTAKAISYSSEIPFIGINHLEAHLCAIFLEHEIPFPFIGLIVSGGHTSLYLVNSHIDYEMVGKTLDDAAGEAFDKGAKVLGLSYPGGLAVDQLSKKGNRKAINFPRPFLKNGPIDFSFSGLKTSLVNYLHKNPDYDDNQLSDICASYQEAIVESLVLKTLNAAKKYNVKSVVIAGGVACNSRLREYSEEKIKNENINLYIPSPKYCTDNAAMIAALGYYKLKSGYTSEFTTTPYSTSRPKIRRGSGIIKDSTFYTS